jgi:hypothetical protein
LLCKEEKLRKFTEADHERERQEARRKGHLDYITDIRTARAEGRAMGRQMGLIHAYEQLLHRPLTPDEQLDQLSLDELVRMAEDLRAQLQRNQQAAADVPINVTVEMNMAPKPRSE